MSEAFIRSHLDRLEDFWRRREAAIAHETTYDAYGYPVRFRTNDAALLDVARASANRYSRCAPIPGGATLCLTFILDHQRPHADIPPDWPARLRYMATEQWLTINAEPWVNAFADLDRWEAVAFVSKAIVQKPYLLSRYIADCFVLNTLLGTGWGQLHASCLVRDGQALLLAAPHNTGKSTTAFRLAMNGYRLLSDGMTYARPAGSRLELVGYPVGEVKLRPDVLDEFPQVREQGEQAWVREDSKMVFNLRREMPERMVDTAFWPDEVVLSLLERPSQRVDTIALPILSEEALVALLPDALHYDRLHRLIRNVDAVRALVARARCYRVQLGKDTTDIVSAFYRL